MANNRIVRAPMRKGRKLSYGQVKQVQKIVNSNKRLKSAWYYLNGTTGSGTPLFTDISAISEGDGYSTRASDQILASSLRVQWSMAPDVTNPLSQAVRVLIVRALKGTLVVGNMPTATQSPNLDLMQVLYDEIIRLPQTTDFSITRFHFKSFKNRKVPHMKIGYVDGESATLAQNNGLYFYAVSTEATDPALISGYAKLKFFDKD